jgi:carbonic anhydrase
VTGIDDLLLRKADLGTEVTGDRSSAVPSLGIAVLTCMDARIKVFDVLALRHGEAHILRNAGGIVTDDAIRSLSISQRRLDTREVLLMQHTACGLSTMTDDEFKDEVEADSGLRPTWSVETFRDVKDSVLQSVERVRRSPYLRYTDNVRGFVYDVHTGDLDEVR